MPDEHNPRTGIRLSWAQLIWGISVVFILGGIWQKMNDLGKTIEELKTEVKDSRITTYSKTEIDSKEKRGYEEILRLWEHVKDIERVTFGREIPK